MATQDTSAYQGPESIKAATKNALHAAGEVSDRKLDQFRDMASDVGERVSQTGKQVTAWSKDHPVQAVLIGASVGFLMGALVRRTAMNGSRR